MSHVADDQAVRRIEVNVPMRDGIHLATDVYIPESPSPTSWPVIMERTPYDKRGISRWEYISEDSPDPMSREELAYAMARAGFVTVMQDCRGRYGSEGVFTKYINEAEDGYDTLAWLQTQSWCDGSVGTMGMSYGAHTQSALAALNPPGLKCMVLDSGGFWNAYREGIRQGGAFELKQVVWAHRHAIRQAEHTGDDAQLASLKEQSLWTWLEDRVWTRGHSPVSAAPEYENYMFEQWERREYSDYWSRPGLAAQEHYSNFPDIPVLVVGSWFDPYVRTSVKHFQSLAAEKRSPIHLIMGPWTHGARVRSYSGDVDFGTDAIFNQRFQMSYLDYRLQWFDHWLKNQSEPMPNQNAVSYFLMGSDQKRQLQNDKIHHGGRWHDASAFPPTESIQRQFDLTPNSKLLERPEKPKESHLSFRSDPSNPTPTIGGAVTSGEPIMFGGAYDQVERPDFFGCSQPGRPLAEREDVLCIETPPLTSPLDVVGEIGVHLAVSSDCPDTDFHVRLIDVFPGDGDTNTTVSINLAHGLLRMRYRNSWTQPDLMIPGIIYPISFKLTPVANRFQIGHRMRIIVSGSNYPHFDVNQNTGQSLGPSLNMRIATNQIHFGGNHRSWLDVPIATALEE